MGAAQPDTEVSDQKAGLIIMMEVTPNKREAPNDSPIVRRRTKTVCKSVGDNFEKNAA